MGMGKRPPVNSLAAQPRELMISRRPSMKPIIWVTIFSTRKAVKDVMPAGVTCWAHLGVPSLGLDPLVFFRFAR